ncbi:hypothetical protein ACIBF1_30465 [Spirillospora sp. NPDC050679]
MLTHAEQHDPRQFQVWHLTCPVCGALPEITCVENGQELRHIHSSRRLSLAERNRRAAAGWMPPELAQRRIKAVAAPQAVPSPRDQMPRLANPSVDIRRSVGLETSPLAKAVLAFLRRTADSEGRVTLAAQQIAIGAGYITAYRPWNDGRKARVMAVMRSLRASGHILTLASPARPGEPITLQVRHDSDSSNGLRK